MAPPSKNRIPLKMHPRVFAALGADLVTSDVVAVIELVKNSYDALASEVWLRFYNEPDGALTLEIQDDGHGMTRKIIEEVWCTVATPFRTKHTVVKAGKMRRRVSGEKGLGRLSVGRLGGNLEMHTKAERQPSWKVTVNWENLSGNDDLDSCYVECEKSAKEVASVLGSSGTILRIRNLHRQWDEETMADLEDNLSRLMTPFKVSEEFRIFLSTPENPEKNEQTAITTEKFLSKPKYLIKGSVSSTGRVTYRYVFKPLDERKPRRASQVLTWNQVVASAGKSAKQSLRSAKKSSCGPFDFEIRAWDLRSADTEKISDAFGIKKNQIRRAISAHKGLSVYRDGILVHQPIS